MHELRQRHCQIRSASVVDGISDFDTLHSGKHDEEVQLCAFDILVEGSDDLRKLPLHLRETSLERPLARRPECIFVNPFERGEIGPDLYRAACRMGLEGRRGALSRRSLGNRKRLRPEITSTSHTRSVPAGRIQEPEKRGRYLVIFNEAAAHFVGDVHSRITRPAFWRC
jgi:hypothetical protein